MTDGLEAHSGATRAAGWALAALAAAVIAGWALQIPEVVQLRPGWASMKLNTAVCFALFAAATLTLAEGRHRAALVCCVVICAIAALTEIQYVSGVDLQIDELLIRAFLAEADVPPGRMSPITAGLFILASVSLGLLTLGQSAARATVAGVAASIIGGVALAALIGYVTKTPTAYNWSAVTSVAAHTAVGFLLVATALGAHAAGRAIRPPAWLPAAAFIGSMACTLALGGALFYELRDSPRSLVPELVIAVGASLSLLIAAALKARLRIGEQHDLLAASLQRMQHALAERAREMDERLAAEQLMHGVLEAAPDGMIVIDESGSIALANTMAGRMFGHEPSTLIGTCVDRLVPEASRPAHAAYRQSYVAQPHARAMGAGRALLGLRKDGSVFPVEISLNSLESGGRTLVVSSVRDITARRAAEQRLQASLQEKELLLKEIHHRVKNNLQVVSSMLTLQSELATDAAARAMLEACRRRVTSMALVHERLYGASDLRRIDLRELIRDIAAMLISGSAGISLRMPTDGAPIVVDIETAFPASLIANELITNAIKHAFVGRSHGSIDIEIDQSSSGRVRLRVADDGVGGVTPATFADTGSLGSTIVRSLVRQIGGVLAVESGAGSRISVTFPLTRSPA